MAIIYSYPKATSLQTTDLFIISRTPEDPDEISNFTVDFNQISSYILTLLELDFAGDVGTGAVDFSPQEVFNIIGTSNEIETTANAQTLQIGLPDNVTIGGDLSVTNRLLVTDNQGDGSTIDSLLSMGSNRIINLSDPVNAQDAATKSYVDTAVTGLLDFKGTFRADTGEILSGSSAGSYLYNCPGGSGTRVAIEVGDYYIVALSSGQFYCSGDLLNIGDSIYGLFDKPADSSQPSDWGIVEGDNIEGSGTANTIPLWTAGQVLGNSMLSQDAGATKVTISGALDLSSSLINNVLDPVAAQDAATKAYVDAVDLDFTGNSGTGNVQQGSTFDILGSGPITTSASGTTLTINSSAAEGTGTTYTLPVWEDGPNGVLSDSAISEVRGGGGGTSVSNVIITTTEAMVNPLSVDFGSGGTTSFKTGINEFIRLTDDSGGFYTASFRYANKLTVDRDTGGTNVSLDVGDADHTYPAAWFRNGVVISNNPSGVQVDNTSMVIGAGNNDNVSGSDHCLIVGSGNQILSNSDQSVAFGQGNTITGSTDALAVGNSNTITSSQRTLALGYSNDVTSASSFVAGGNNTANSGDTNIVIGYNSSSVGSNNFAIGNEVESRFNEMVLGFRNNTTYGFAVDYPKGLSEVKFVVATGASTNINSNALLITAGGKNVGNPSVPQIPRVILPTVRDFSATSPSSADAIGVPRGGLYHNSGIVLINTGTQSTIDPLSNLDYVKKSGDTMTGDLVMGTNSIFLGGTGTANELNDYEEGVWTPRLVNTGGIGITYTTQQATYIKVGKMVYIKALITVNTLGFNSSSGQFGVNLPFIPDTLASFADGLGNFNPIVNNFITNGSTSNYKDTYNVNIVFNSSPAIAASAQFLLPSTSYGGSGTIATSSFLPATTGNGASFRFSGVYQSTT